MNLKKKKKLEKNQNRLHASRGDGNSLAEFRSAYKFEMHRVMKASRCTEVRFAVCSILYFKRQKSKWINSLQFSGCSALFQ